MFKINKSQSNLKFQEIIIIIDNNCHKQKIDKLNIYNL